MGKPHAQFTKNEKKVLKLLLDNARIPDSAIATCLRITSQAVGRIREKLEDSVIDSYTANLSYSRMGLQVFALGIARIAPQEGEDTSVIEKKLLDEPHVIHAYRVPGGYPTHILLYGFRDLPDMDAYFSSMKNKQGISRHIEHERFYTFSHNNIVKNSPAQLFKKVMDGSELQRNTQ